MECKAPSYARKATRCLPFPRSAIFAVTLLSTFITRNEDGSASRNRLTIDDDGGVSVAYAVSPSRWRIGGLRVGERVSVAMLSEERRPLGMMG
jgi:hypothetical protein